MDPASPSHHRSTPASRTKVHRNVLGAVRDGLCANPGESVGDLLGADIDAGALPLDDARGFPALLHTVAGDVR